jgi:hypothetical protein
MPQNYKISLSLSGLHYQSLSCSCTGSVENVRLNNVNAMVKWISSSGFGIEVKVETVSRLQFLKTRYLAVNFRDPSLFHVHLG